MDEKTAFKTLELNCDASFAEIRLQYRDLVSIWHPDRHAQNIRLLKKAEDKTKEINAAYDVLNAYLNGNKTNNKETKQSGKTKYQVINCINCEAKNRIPINTTFTDPLCGMCGSPLYNSKKNWERTPCGDTICTGILNESGKCGYCGKNFKEGVSESEKREQNQNINPVSKKIRFTWHWALLFKKQSGNKLY